MSILTDVQVASIFGEIADNIHRYAAAEVKSYALYGARCRIDAYLLARCGQEARQQLEKSEKAAIRKRFKSYLKDVLSLDGDDVTVDHGFGNGVAAKTVELPTNKGIEDVTTIADNTVVGYKAFRNRAVLNRGRPFPSYEKARQYIRRHITTHIGAENYNDDQRITMPVDSINRNYPNITALGYAIKKAA